MAYKSIDDIVGSIADTVDIIGVIKPVYNFKASERVRAKKFLAYCSEWQKRAFSSKRFVPFRGTERRVRDEKEEV